MGAAICSSGCLETEKPVGDGGVGQEMNENTKNENAEEIEEDVAGGWARGAVDEEVSEAAAVAMKGLATRGPEPKLKRITKVEKQVVAGLNFRLQLELDDGTLWDAVVHRNLAGEHSLTSLEKSKD